MKVESGGDHGFEAKLVANYDRLCRLDTNYNYHCVKTHPTKMFSRRRGVTIISISHLPHTKALTSTKTQVNRWSFTMTS